MSERLDQIERILHETIVQQRESQRWRDEDFKRFSAKTDASIERLSAEIAESNAAAMARMERRDEDFKRFSARTDASIERLSAKIAESNAAAMARMDRLEEQRDEDFKRLSAKLAEGNAAAMARTERLERILEVSVNTLVDIQRETNQRMDETNQRLNETNHKLDETNHRLDETIKRFDLFLEFAGTETRSHRERLDRLETRVARLEDTRKEKEGSDQE